MPECPSVPLQKLGQGIYLDIEPKYWVKMRCFCRILDFNEPNFFFFFSIKANCWIKKDFFNKEIL